MPKVTTKPTYGNFKPLSAETRYRLIWRSWGLEKAGKNHFGFTAPGPVFGQYFDPGGVEGVAEKFIKGEVEGCEPKEIQACFYRFKKDSDDQDAAREVMEQFTSDYKIALESARTIQWDETEFWACVRFANFGRESGMPRDYGPINAFYRGLLQDAYDAGVNLQLIQKVKEVWKENKRGDSVPSGDYAPQGFKEANYVVQMNLCHTWEKGQGFGVQVVNCRQNMEMAGETFYNTNFTEMAMQVFPGTNESDWC